jgi:hypothetical protein
MRAILAAFIFAFLAIPALAQPSARQQGELPGQQRTKDQRDAQRPVHPELKAKRAREEERAAKSALERLPDKPFDPWRNVR